MKKCLLVLCVLLLSACIDVDDFGAYWAKGAVDPSMVGNWEKQQDNSKDRNDIKHYSVTIKGDTYIITPTDGKDPKSSEPLTAKLLTDGPYNFLMSGDGKKGSLYRYKIMGGMFQLYTLDIREAYKFVEQTYPHARNIDTKTDHSSVAPFFSIKTLDEETFKILASIPDNSNYWTLESEYKKLP